MSCLAFIFMGSIREIDTKPGRLRSESGIRCILIKFKAFGHAIGTDGPVDEHGSESNVYI
jgi:hypothetical protein